MLRPLLEAANAEYACIDKVLMQAIWDHDEDPDFLHLTEPLTNTLRKMYLRGDAILINKLMEMGDFDSAARRLGNFQVDIVNFHKGMEKHNLL